MKKMSVVTGAVLMTASIFAVDLSTNVSTENVTEQVEEISILTDDDLEENMKKENLIIRFFKKAFRDMKEDAKAQHEVDKANFNAVKAESKALWEEAKAMGNPEKRKEMKQAERNEQIKAANQRIKEAQARIEATK